ncbi:MAG: cytidylate kinase-like family protein [Eubacteriales bacterium]|nr:cytidylate kinase-like family protein [Eubacteriales bacterium]
MKKIITISRQFGAGGGEIGRKLSDALGIEYYDKDMVMRTALMDPKLDPAMVNRWENKASSKMSMFYGLFDTYTKPMDVQIFEAQKKAIFNMADKESCIILGRNANYLLKNYDHVLRVYVYASENWRVNRMCGLMPDVSKDEIAAKTKKIDGARRKNCQNYTGHTLGDPDGYDLCINTEKIGIDLAVQLILETLKAREA